MSLVKERSLQGSDKYKNKDYNGADIDYTYCIDNADSNDSDLANYYSNRCATRLQLGKIQEALEDSNSAICVKPTWYKGYSRKGGCLVRLNKLQEAIYAYEKALELEPNNYEISQALDNTRRRMNGDSRTSSSSPFSSINNNVWVKKAKHFISLGIAKFNQILSTMDENTKKMIGMAIIGLFLYYFIFRKRRRIDDYDDYDYGYGRSSYGMSWSTWLMIMGAAYYLPPMFPQLGQYALPFFGMNFTTFMYLLQMLQGRGMGMGMPGMGGLFGGGGRRNRRYY